MSLDLPPQSERAAAAEGWVAIQRLREEGLSVHQLGVAAVKLLAEHEVFTTEIPRDPGTFHAFQQTRRLEEAHQQITAKTKGVFGKIPEFQGAVQEERLGATLVDVFARVVQLEAREVHIPESNIDDEGIEHGTVIAKDTLWTVDGDDAESHQSATMLSLALNAILHSNVHQSSIVEGATVHYRELNEHQARSLARIIGALVIEGFANQTPSVTLPPDKKRSLYYWEEVHGESFPPAIRQQLQQANTAYQQLSQGRKVGSYDHPDQISPVNREDNQLIVNDFAAPLQGIRDIFNGLIHAVRGGSHHNKEQNPDENARPHIEHGIELTRDIVSSDEEWKGPPSSRALSMLEKLQMSSSNALEDAKKKPGAALLRAAGRGVGLAGAGLLELGLKVAEYGPHASRSGKQLAEDIREWKRRKEEYEAALRQFDNFTEQKVLDILVNAHSPRQRNQQ